MAMRERMIEDSISTKGLSIIIPVYNGLEFMDRVLNNLYNQEISDANFETIFIFNGKFNEELSFLYEDSNYYNALDITVLINDKKGAGAARNLGVKYAKYSHITFLDIDDYVSTNFEIGRASCR